MDETEPTQFNLLQTTQVTPTPETCPPLITASTNAILPTISFTCDVDALQNPYTTAAYVIASLSLLFPQKNFTNFTLDIAALLIARNLGASPKRDTSLAVTWTLNDNGNTTLRTFYGQVLSAWANGANSDPNLFPFVSPIQFSWAYTNSAGQLVEVTPPGTVAQNATVAPVAGSSSNGKVLSKGALAGVIIGVFFGAVILCLILLFIYLRTRETYPLPFRSPAAAYRP